MQPQFETLWSYQHSSAAQMEVMLGGWVISHQTGYKTGSSIHVWTYYVIGTQADWWYKCMADGLCNYRWLNGSGGRIVGIMKGTGWAPGTGQSVWANSKGGKYPSLYMGRESIWWVHKCENYCVGEIHVVQSVCCHYTTSPFGNSNINSNIRR